MKTKPCGLRPANRKLCRGNLIDTCRSNVSQQNQNLVLLNRKKKTWSQIPKFNPNTCFIPGCPIETNEDEPLRAVIHGEVNKHVLKLASGLLANMTTAAHEVFTAVKNRVLAATNQPWLVWEMVSDFESVIMTAAENSFPGINVHCCYFHFSQALRMRVQRLGLAATHRRDPHIKRFVQKTMALGFLPLNIVRINWDNLRNSLNTQALVATYPALGRFIRYFTANWMNQNGVFRPRRWNVHNRRMEYRTNNAIESYNRAWNWFVAARRPSLWVFLTKLKQRQTISAPPFQPLLPSCIVNKEMVTCIYHTFILSQDSLLSFIFNIYI